MLRSIFFYLSVSYCALVLPLWSVTAYHCPLLDPSSSVFSYVFSNVSVFFEILFVAKYIGNTNADFIHALS